MYQKRYCASNIKYGLDLSYKLFQCTSKLLEIISSKIKYHDCESWININDEISKGKTVLRDKTVKSKQKEIEK